MPEGWRRQSQPNKPLVSCVVGKLVLGEVGRWDLQVGGLYAPDLSCILGDSAVTGELARAGNILDHLLGPLLGILSEEEEMINLW